MTVTFAQSQASNASPSRQNPTSAAMSALHAPASALVHTVALLLVLVLPLTPQMLPSLPPSSLARWGADAAGHVDGLSPPPTALALQACGQPGTTQWHLDEVTGLLHPGPDSAAGCVAASLPPTNSGPLQIVPCDAAEPEQQWTSIVPPDVGFSVVALRNASAPGVWGWVTVAGGVTPGTAVWLFNISSALPFCSQYHSCAFNASGATGGQGGGTGEVRGPGSDTCVAVQAPPTNATTCGVGSPSAGLDFCNQALPFEQRASLLVAHLTTTEKLQLWTVTTMNG